MTLAELNTLNTSLLKDTLFSCCGSTCWIEKMITVFPVPNARTLLNEAEKKWYECNENDWKEAFAHHPRIGDIKSLKEKFASTSKWAEGEQAGVKQTSVKVLEALAEGNKLYEDKFGYIFIVFATGKSAEEMLSLLQKRLPNKPATEIKIAMEEQNKITKLRLQKLLAS